MSPSNNSVYKIVKAGLCMGCGTCEAICPAGAIRIHLAPKSMTYLPIIDFTKCSKCGLCRTVCPGKDVDFCSLSKKFTPHGKYHEKLGKFLSLHIGHAVSNSIRAIGASGGLITSALVQLLETNKIDGALVLQYEENNPLRTQPIIAYTSQEIIDASSSKYCPSCSNIKLREILESPKTRFAYVGLPCQIHALRKWQEIQPKLTEKIKYVFGLFCANNNSYKATTDFLRLNKIPADNVSRINYRYGKWPGSINVMTKHPQKQYLFKRGTTETDIKKKRLFSNHFHFHYQIPRCLLCRDQTAELADISFADPHISTDFYKENRRGVSWCVIRTGKGRELYEICVIKNVWDCKNFPLQTAEKSQNYHYKEMVGTRILWRKRFGFSTPNYGIKLNSTASTTKALLPYIPSYLNYRVLKIGSSTLIKAACFTWFNLKSFFARLKQLGKRGEKNI